MKTKRPVKRKLLCIRTYIHLNLFFSFILRGLAVFVKDAVLFADQSMNHCTFSTVKCKVAVTFFQSCVLANFFWLLVEGLYLQTLLVFTFTQKKKLFWVYTVIGWGTPSVTILIWALMKIQFDNEGSDVPTYRRLARSTLLLIPLFGVHYVIFALFPEHVGVGPRLYLELVLGSFQGFIVALLYCFLNKEVQNEIGKVMKGFWPQTENIAFNLATQDYDA
ncbi:growth hormone releasing hormone receptor 2 [Aplochiton taeniatus]